MSKMNFDEEGILEEPCISCNKCYVDNLFNEWCCDVKECPHKIESDGKGGYFRYGRQPITILPRKEQK